MFSGKGFLQKDRITLKGKDIFNRSILFFYKFAPSYQVRFLEFGAWRSWLAYLHGVQGVGSSSLLAPTFKINHLQAYFVGDFFVYTVIY